MTRRVWFEKRRPGEAARRLRIGRRLQVYPDHREWWVGLRVAPGAVYACPAPCLVVRWLR